jgi:hypothetical protein
MIQNQGGSMAHEYITDLPKNIAEYRRNQALIAKAEQENVILARRIQRLENLDEYYKRGERAKRAHRLITKGAAIESIWPESRKLEDAAFYQLMRKILISPNADEIRKAHQAEHPLQEEEGDD